MRSNVILACVLCACILAPASALSTGEQRQRESCGKIQDIQECVDRCECRWCYPADDNETAGTLGVNNNDDGEDDDVGCAYRGDPCSSGVFASRPWWTECNIGTIVAVCLAALISCVLVFCLFVCLCHFLRRCRLARGTQGQGYARQQGLASASPLDYRTTVFSQQDTTAGYLDLGFDGGGDDDADDDPLLALASVNSGHPKRSWGNRRFLFRAIASFN